MGRPPKDGEDGGVARRSPKWSAASTYMRRRRVPPEAGIGRSPLPLPSPGARVPTPLPPPDRLEPWPASRVCSGWGGGWVVGWGFEPHSRATLGFLFGCGAGGAAVSHSGLEGAASG